MFKKMLIATVISGLALTSVATVAGAAEIQAPSAQTGVVAAPPAVSPAEAASLQFMREEEKLAHDVYVTLYEQWGLRLFNNIAASEQTHTNAVAWLLDRYDIDDPAADTGFGEFANADLQALYDQLVEQGARSGADALKVGLAIEEIDILDLQKRVAETSNADIERV